MNFAKDYIEVVQTDGTIIRRYTNAEKAENWYQEQLAQGKLNIRKITNNLTAKIEVIVKPNR